MLTSTQKEWTALSADIDYFRTAAADVGQSPKGAIVLSAVSVASSRDEAHDRAFEYLGREWAMIDAHYRFSEGRLATISGVRVVCAYPAIL